MFFPTRYNEFVVYDIKLLLSCDTRFEERLFVEATKLIPEVFSVGDMWGEELTQSCIWIHERVHDTTYKRIRELLRSDHEFLINAISGIKASIETANSIINSSSDQEVIENVKQSYSEIIRVVSWFSCNWLHPISVVRQTLIRLFGTEQMQAIFEQLLTSSYRSKYLSISPKAVTGRINNTTGNLLKSNGENEELLDKLKNYTSRLLTKEAKDLFLTQVEFLGLLSQEEECRRLMITRINKVIINFNKSTDLEQFCCDKAQI